MSPAATLPPPQRVDKLKASSTPSPKGVFSRFGTYLHLYIIVGVAIPVMIYVAVMQTLGWRMPIIGANGVFSYIAGSTSQVALYASPATKTYFTSIGGNYEFLLSPWRDYFADRKLRVKEITGPDQLKRMDEGVLVLPSAVALSVEERTEISAFRARGGAVLSTWASGTRNAKGEWEGWAFTEQLGAKVLGELAADADVNHLITNGESPVAHTLPAGQRIFVSRASESLLRLQGDGIAARFMNWARIPVAERRGEGAVVFSETTAQAGRTVVFGFAETAWASHPAAAYALIDDVIAWLQREPKLVHAAWPSGKLAAHVIEMDTEEGFANASNLATMLDSIDYPTTFFVLTSVGKKFPDTVAQLARQHEIALHGDIHTSFKDQPPAQQEQRIKTMMADMAAMLPNKQGIVGFRAPTEGYDATTEKLLQQNGLRYHVADPNRSEARLPKMALVPGADLESDLVVLPRTQRDDINFFWEKLPPDQLAQAMSDDAALVLENGGLGLLSVHSQNFAENSDLYKAMPAYLLYLKQRRATLWLASAGQVADWWRQRERFKIKSRNSGRRLELDVSVLGKTPVQGGTVMVMLPQKDLVPTVKSTKTGGAAPAVQKVDAYRAAIIFPSLAPGNYSYQITFGQ